MSVIITKTFQKDAIKIFGNIQSWELFYEIFIKSEKFALRNPFKKFKFSFQRISIRGIYVMSEKQSYIPIFIVKKSDKQYGMNLVITPKNIAIIEHKYEKSIADISSGNYITF